MKDDSYVPQAQLSRLEHLVAPGKVVVVYGPRRVGKTTLIRRYARQHDPDALVVTGEDISVREYLESESLPGLRAFVGRRRTLIVDEAQYVRGDRTEPEAAGRPYRRASGDRDGLVVLRTCAADR